MYSEKKHLNKHESVNLNSTPLMLWGLAILVLKRKVLKVPLFFEKSTESLYNVI